MMSKNPLLNFLWVIGVIFLGFSKSYGQANPDTIGYTWTSSLFHIPVLYRKHTEDSVAEALLHGEENFFQKPSHLEALFQFLHSPRLKKENRNRRITQKLYYRLAKIFARMKLYPLAMQCYSNTNGFVDTESVATPINEEALPGTRLPMTAITKAFPFQNSIHSLSPDTGEITGITNYRYDTNIISPLLWKEEPESDPISTEEISNTFEDGKKAMAYAVLFHVKQPVRGSRQAFSGIRQVGHTFITLIKYNMDSSAVSRSFGFYPEKDNLLSATPLIPVSSSVFKNDSLHGWDESIGKFISHNRFRKILRLLHRYNKRSYHLNHNNCTDFGLAVGAIIGVEIKYTAGEWPLGHGNNPANTGQSIYEGRFWNADTQNKTGLFICTLPK